MELPHLSLWEHNLGLVSGAPVKPVWRSPYVLLFLWDRGRGGGSLLARPPSDGGGLRCLLVAGGDALPAV